MGFDASILKQPKMDLIKKVLLAFLADMLLGFGIAFNACMGYGNDPVSVLYDGVHNKFGCDLGFATNLVNFTVFIVVLILGRKYINIGTLIYAAFLGFFVNLGVHLYRFFSVPDIWQIKVPMSILSCSMLFFGVAIYIALRIGVDQWTGLVLVLRDKTSRDYRIFRVIVDTSAGALGWLLGGRVGIVTICAMFLGGPVIQWFADFIEKYLLRLFKFEGKQENKA